MAGSPFEHEIAGAYQLDALLKGWPLQRAWHRARLDLVARVLPPDRESLALDAAAGAGIVTWRFRESQIVNADMRLSACRAVRAHTPHAVATAAELGALPFRPATFSTIYFLEAIEHLTERDGRRALEELRRVSRPGARCLITTPNYRSHWALIEALLDRFHLTPPMAHGQHVSHYDGHTLGRMVESSGWTVVHIGSFNLFAPFVGIVSRWMGARAIDLEATRAGFAGALLYAVCRA